MTDLMLSKTVSMSSLEISQMVKVRHDSVIRTVKRLAAKGVVQSPPMVEIKNNQSVGPRDMTQAYMFEGVKGRRDSIVIVAQLSPQFTAVLVDRWEELENEVAQLKAAPAKPLVDPKAYREAPKEFNSLAFQKAINTSHKLIASLPGISQSDRYNLLTRVTEQFLPGMAFTPPEPPAPPVFTPAEKAKVAPSATPAVKAPTAAPTNGETKVCNTCNTEKPVTEFRKDGDSYRGRCKPCHSAYEIARRAGK